MKRLSLITALSLAMLMGACSMNHSHPNAPAWAARVDYSGLWVKVEDIQTYENRSGAMEMVAKIASKAPMDRKIKYRVLWYEDNGRPIQTVLGKWNERLLKAGQTIELIEVGPGPRAADYRLEIED